MLPTSGQYAEFAEPHKARTQAILQDHPEIRELMGPNRFSLLYIVALVVIQITIALVLSAQPWWIVIVAAYLFGAFAFHALFVLIHECSHNLVCKTRNYNLMAAILANLTHLVPSAISFKTYHLIHHKHQGVYELDADIPSHLEAKLFGHSIFGKVIWLALLPLLYILRPVRIRGVDFFDSWVCLNMVAVIVVDVLIFQLGGITALGYLLLSIYFFNSFHPLTGRIIQEHFVFYPRQETYSYYGLLNRLSFNVGYHNEHHDFPSIPWHRLADVRKIAPEYYDTLRSHRSWSKLLLDFIRNPEISLSSRVLRKNKRQKR